MVAYMDTKVGQILNKLEETGLASNTMIVYVSDNGTPKGIYSLWNGITIQGAKGGTTMYGNHVPLIISTGDAGRAGAVANTLIDFSDFLPTLATVAGTSVGHEYGTIDGVNFYNSIQGTQDSIRPWVFFHWQDIAMNDYHRWAQTAQYKLYDVTDRSKFSHYAVDPLELNPIPASRRTAEQKAAAKMLKAVLDSMHL